MAFMVLKGTFTRPSTDVPFYEISNSDKEFIQRLKNSGLIEDRVLSLSEDGLTEVRSTISFVETVADIAVISSNLRIDPGWYELHITYQEYCDMHNIKRGPILIEAYSSDWLLLHSSQFLVSDLF